MILNKDKTNKAIEGVPRVGGGDPELKDKLTDANTCSPRRRG